jgi:GDPmannose 4,6-dehydratase
MWLILQKEEPDDYVVGTGVTHSVEEFARKAFEHVGLNYKDYITIDNDLIRPAEVSTLSADYTKAKKKLKWKPEITFENLIIDMVESDLEFTKNYKY